MAIAGFFDVAGIRRYAHIRRSAAVFAGLALAGVLALGVLQGLIVAAGLTLVYVVQRLSRPTMTELRRDEDTVLIRCDAPLLYPNANAVKEQVLALSAGAGVVVLDLEVSVELDVQSADMLLELAAELRRDGIELRLARVHAPARAILRRAGVTDQVSVEAAPR